MPQSDYHSKQPHPAAYQYDAYDGSDNDSDPGSRPPSSMWEPQKHASMPVNKGSNGGSGGGGSSTTNGNSSFDFGTSHVRPQHAPISVNTQFRDPNRDSLSQHLLYENALLDSANFDTLDIEEVDSLKKELVRLNSRIQAAQHKLALESKVKDAAHNLHRLYALQRSRPDTPQRNDSKGSAKGLFGDKRANRRGSDGVEALLQAQTELTDSLKKVYDLNETIKDLLERRALVERRLLSHTAAVLAEEANNKATSAVVNFTNGHHSMYVLNEFDDLRDILHGAPPDSLVKIQQYEEQMSAVQDRLENLNAQLRDVIDAAGRTLGKSAGQEHMSSEVDDASELLEQRFSRLENSLHTLHQQQQDMRAHCARIQESEQQSLNSVEGQMENLNKELHDTLIEAAGGQSLPGLVDPPTAGGRGYSQQLQYMQQMLQHFGLVLHASKEANDTSTKTQLRLTEYEDTVAGLWDILQSDAPSPRLGGGDGFDFGLSNTGQMPGTPFREPFSLQAFSSKVQHLFDRVHSAKEQQDILRRQIQQQRELNGRSDAEKDRQIEDMQTAHDRLTAEREQAQEELARLMVQHQQSESEANQLRSEHMNVINEVDELKRSVDARQQERDAMSKSLQTHQSHIQQLEAELAELQLTADAKDDVEAKLAEVYKDMEDMESEVARLATELATAKADLAERKRDTSVEDAAEAKMAEVYQDMRNLESEVARLTTELTMAKAELEDKQQAASAKDAAEAKLADVQKDMENLESEVIRLTTELTMAKADLDVAHGSRAERAGAAKAAEHTAQLERELAEMADEFQAMTKESIQQEKEREQLDRLIDELRDRVNTLEAQLGDEKFRWLGMKSPSTGPTTPGADGGMPRESMSMTVLRQEFKKMVRETRAEGVRLIRAEQEERRRLETELRKIRQANSPLGRLQAQRHSRTQSQMNSALSPASAAATTS